MKKLLFLLIAVATLSSCNLNFNRKGGPQVTSVRHTKPFDRIDISSACDVKFTQGDTFGVKIVGEKDAVEKIKTQFSGNTLTITTDDHLSFDIFANPSSPVIYVTSPDLVDVKLKGVGDFDVEGNLDTDTLNVFIKGVGDVNLNNVICDEFFGTLVGTGDVNVQSLTAQRAVIKLKGTGDIDVNFLNSGDAECTLKGTGDITLSGTLRSLKKDLHGTGDIDLDDLKIMRP
ncbi:MAG: DUF2807 domain-containing protein [Prevotella sp.]|nr:DUF2807 domain-containing protein [Prevotella sp.]